MQGNESRLRLIRLGGAAHPLTQAPLMWIFEGKTTDRLSRCVDRNHLERGVDDPEAEEVCLESSPATSYVSLEAEIPEVLYRGMKEFIGTHPAWDQNRVMSSALANFLFQNGSSDRAVTERYLNDLFSRPSA